MDSFKRSIEVHVAGRAFSSEDLYIEFEVPFDDDTTPNESEIRIYNLSDSTVNQLKRNQTLVLNAGYDGDVGVLLSGRVSSVSARKDGADKIVTIHVLDSSDLTGVKVDSLAFAANVRGSTILKTLVPKLGVPLAAFLLPADKTYSDGYTLSGSISDNIAEVAKDCGAAAYINKGKLYIRALSDGDDARFVLAPSTGLVGSPEYFMDDETDNGYNVTCLLQYRITTASIIQLDSLFVKGKFRVRRGTHVCNSNEFVTEMEVIG